MGVDWHSLTWWEYQVMLTEWNLRQPGGADGEKDFTRLKLAMDAHTVH